MKFFSVFTLHHGNTGSTCGAASGLSCGGGPRRSLRSVGHWSWVIRLAIRVRVIKVLLSGGAMSASRLLEAGNEFSDHSHSFMFGVEGMRAARSEVREECEPRGR